MNESDPSRAAAIRELNDRFRQTLQGGTVVMTAGIVALGDAAQARIIGAIEIEGERAFFKLDYYDLARAVQSEDPADPSKTERVLTIMLADEY